MSARPVLDVTVLPEEEFDHRAPVWWGNLLLIAIETTMFALLVATYFYVYLYTSPFPPPRNDPPQMLDTLPDWMPGVVNLLVIVGSCLPMYFADRAARREDGRRTVFWLVACIALGVVMIVLRAFEFPAMHFRWDANAYASTVWFVLGFHLMHLSSSTVETAFIAAWIAMYGIEEKHALDATVNAVYWYWMCGVWVPLFLVLYVAPRVL